MLFPADAGHQGLHHFISHADSGQLIEGIFRSGEFRINNGKSGRDDRRWGMMVGNNHGHTQFIGMFNFRDIGNAAVYRHNQSHALCHAVHQWRPGAVRGPR